MRAGCVLIEEKDVNGKQGGRKRRFDLRNESLLILSLSLFVCLSLMCKVCNSTSLCLPPFLPLLDINNPKTLLMNQKKDRKKNLFCKALGDLESYSFCIIIFLFI